MRKKTTTKANAPKPANHNGQPAPFRWYTLDDSGGLITKAANVPGGVLIRMVDATRLHSLFVPFVAVVPFGDSAQLVSAMEGFMGQMAERFGR